MNTGGDVDAGRRVLAAMRALPGILRRDLFTVAIDPLPPMKRPRWLARLPHLLVVVYAALVLVSFPGIGRPSVMLAAVQAAAVVVAMFRPMLAWWVIMAAMVAGALGGVDHYPWSRATIAAMCGVVVLLALRVRPRVVVEVLASSVLAGLACAGFEVHTSSPDAGWIVAVFYIDVGQVVALWGLAAFLGAVRRARRVSHDRLLTQQQISAEERARRSLLEERTRIARELHDVVAHHLSVISIQAQVAPHLVTDPPEELIQNLAGIRGNALEALAELRRVLGVLRVDQPGVDRLPQPTLAQLDELIDNVRRAGLSVTAQITGVPRPLPPGIELSAYRIVQEALSNAMRHAPGAVVRVLVVYQHDGVAVRVANTVSASRATPSSEAGHGLLGMRERVAMFGGTLSSGPTDDGGYTVTATLPSPAPTPIIQAAEDST